MKRRDVLKAAAVAAGAAVVGVSGEAKAACCERDHDGDGNCDRHPVGKVHVLFSLVLPGPYNKLSDQFREGIEGFEAQWPGMVVTEPVAFQPYDKDGNDWLMSPAWKGEDRTLHTKPDNVFKDRRWAVVKRATDLRRHCYWGQEVEPTLESIPPGMSLSSPSGAERELVARRTKATQAWHKAQLDRLGSVGVQFLALVTPHPRDVEAVKTPFTPKDLVGFKRIKS